MHAFHALVLNLHQPPGNLEHLLEHNPWEVKEILYAMDRIPRSLWGYEDVARVHLSFSGTLLETLSSPEFQNRVYGDVDVGAMLWHFQNRELFEILGTGYYHPVLPLIPEADRKEHLLRWRGIAEHMFWRQDFPGLWPPEMGFSMELIPLLKTLGYRYVLVDSEHVEAVEPMDWTELRYRPHIARHGGEEIIVVVRDRDLSNAQESGMELGWFQNEIEQRTRWCEFPPLVTTCSDGENGGWFRNTTEGANFWSAFYQPLLERARNDDKAVRPIFIQEYLDRYGARGEVRVDTGAWNTGWHHGREFTQWTGSWHQQRVLQQIKELSKRIHDTRWRAGEIGVQDQAIHAHIEEALWRLLRAETSCNIYWGEDWVGKAEDDLDAALGALTRALAGMESESTDVGC